MKHVMVTKTNANARSDDINSLANLVPIYSLDSLVPCSSSSELGADAELELAVVQ